MKKTISILLLISTLILCLASCKNSNSEENNSQQNAAHTEHDNVAGKCSVCDLDYFEILRNAVLEKGTPFSNSVVSESEGIYELIIADRKIQVMCWSNSPDSLEFRYYPYGYSAGDCQYLTLSFDRANVKYCEYNWDYNTDSYSYLSKKWIKGTIVAADFKEITDTLTYTKGDNETNADRDASLAASYIKKIITQGIPEVLANNEYNISAKHFGFKYFD